jgi:GH35 family endo-1,4-beta-xylanase
VLPAKCLTQNEKMIVTIMFCANTVKPNPGMKKLVLVLSLFAAVLSTPKAQKLQPLPQQLHALNPVNLFPADAAENYKFSNRSAAEKPPLFDVNKTGANAIYTAENFSPAKGHGDVQVVWKNTAPIKKGDALLARFALRAQYAKQESGEAVVYFSVQAAERLVIVDVTAGPEWRYMDIPFVSPGNVQEGEATITFTFGALAQKVQLADVQVLNFENKATMSQLPITKLTYAGRDEAAAWRKEALKRIEDIRTAPLVVRVVDGSGKAVKGAKVEARLIDPSFLFGTAVSVNLVNGTDSNAAIYKRYLHELFNAVTIDNNLKWPEWRDAQKREKTNEAVAWIVNNGFRLRGHNLVWPGKKFSPSFFSRQPGFGPSFGDSINAHIRDIVTAMRGKVYGWDVINEMLYEKDYFEVLPRTEAAEWFKLAKKYDPGATLFVNEYSMLNNIASPQNIKTYLGVIQELRGYGAPIDAIGVQGHVGRQPRDPQSVISDLDLFTPTGLPVQITEFDINSPDEELQADYTRDFLIACYSHPLVTGFTMWGFWEPAHWKPDAALFKTDWTAKPNVAAYRDLVLKQWRTRINGTTSPDGKLNAMGHLGRYDITVTSGNKKVKRSYTLTKNGEPVAITLQ